MGRRSFPSERGESISSMSGGTARYSTSTSGCSAVFAASMSIPLVRQKAPGWLWPAILGRSICLDQPSAS